MYLCIFVLKHWDLVFDILESPDFQKYSMLGLSSTRFEYLCVYLTNTICDCLCGIGVWVDSRGHEHLENIWFDGSLKLGN